MSNPIQHDPKCELLGGFHSCKCAIRSRGQHPALYTVADWWRGQNPKDQKTVVGLMDKLNEEMHRIDIKQESLSELQRPRFVPPVFIMRGGPDFKISVKGTIYTFEMHPLCGPVALDGNGDPADEQPLEFLEAASLWAQQGQITEDGMAVYYVPGKPITEHIGGLHHKVVGYTEPTRGE